MAQPSEDDLLRFLLHINQTNGCWNWVASVDKDGYGSFYFQSCRMAAHRFAYMVTVGPIPDGTKVCHQCDNPCCCRPDHLFTGTHADNHADRNRKGRQAKGESINTAKLNPEKVRAIRGLKGVERQAAVARRFNVSKTAVCKIWNGENWGHLPD